MGDGTGDTIGLDAGTSDLTLSGELDANCGTGSNISVTATDNVMLSDELNATGVRGSVTLDLYSATVVQSVNRLL